ncbi:MAG: glycine cleavage system protein GcvH [Cyanobacteriota bacterium]
MSKIKYAESHEYISLEDDIGTIGITEHAIEQLGDIVYVELPKVGTKFQKGDTFGVVESVKAVSDLYCPVSGEVIEINELLNDKPELLVDGLFDDKWIIRVQVNDLSELDSLLEEEDYNKVISK